MQKDGEMTTQHGETIPKYACGICGSDEVRGDFDSYPVFLAQDDKIIYLRSETIVAGLSALYCNQCDEEIESDDYGEIEIE